ncbi:glycosyltransferase family 4 protein [Spirosoma pulveris]
MKVLWLSGNASSFEANSKYNGGGWISALEKAFLKAAPDVEIGVAFFSNSTVTKVKKNGVTYYPINSYTNLFKKVKHALFYKHYDKVEVEEYLKVISDFNPDIIHVWGSEMSFGLVSLYTTVPVVIHIQGLLTPYSNAYFPPAVSERDFYELNISKNLRYYFTRKFIKHNESRELEILKHCKNFIGRTEWDKRLIDIYAPHANYFECWELMRPAFYNASAWSKPSGVKLTIVSTISKSIYKGFDLILKAAQLLKKQTSVDFEWKVFGVTDYKFWEDKLGINAKEVNIECMGIASEDVIINTMLNASVYVHPSYIENSPNSLCEAQLLGIPVIATNVGGISSIIQDGVTGLMVPANDPYILLSKILDVYKDEELATSLGGSGHNTAKKRHNPVSIVNVNLNIYESILTSNQVDVLEHRL